MAQSETARTRPIMTELLRGARTAPDDEKRAEGDGLMAVKPKQRNMSHATLALNRAHPPPAVRRIVPRRTRHWRPCLSGCRQGPQTGSDQAWQKSGFFIWAVL